MTLHKVEGHCSVSGLEGGHHHFLRGEIVGGIFLLLRSILGGRTGGAERWGRGGAGVKRAVLVCPCQVTIVQWGGRQQTFIVAPVCVAQWGHIWPHPGLGGRLHLELRLLDGSMCLSLQFCESSFVNVCISHPPWADELARACAPRWWQRWVRTERNTWGLTRPGLRVLTPCLRAGRPKSQAKPRVMGQGGTLCPWWSTGKGLGAGRNEKLMQLMTYALWL